MDFTAIILAAGKGTRMRSSLPKSLHEIAGRPMLGHILAATAEAGATQIILVSAPDQQATRDYADDYADTQTQITHCLQEQADGTGSAVRLALPHIKEERVVVLFGDTPLIGAQVLRELATAPADVAVMGFTPQDTARYGRIVMERDQPQRIVEFKDLTPQHQDIKLCNGGAMGLSHSVLKTLLPLLTNNNAQQEYLLPHIVEHASAAGNSTALIMATEEDTLGVDDRAALAVGEALMQTRLRAAHLANGVTMRDPASVFLSFDTKIAADVILEPHIQINPGVSIGAGSVIKSFSHLEGVSIGENVQVGPFARLRPQTQIEDGARIGNFVEIKKAQIGSGSKVSHLAYIGDAQLGAGVNVGAGVITCNYDGETKHLTQIEDGAFIGSNSSLIAPITIGARAYVGSGSSLSNNVKADSLVVTRASVREVANYSKRKKK